MSSHICGRVLAIASAALLSACKTFSPDGGMGTVATIAGQGLNKDVVRVSSPADAAYAQTRVALLLKPPLSADAAVQIALLNNAALQAAYNRLGVAEAVAVQASRPPLPTLSYDWVKTSLELDIERQVVASVLQLATWPARSKIAGVRFQQAELRAAEETLRIAAETRKAYYNAVAAREILSALNSAKANAQASAELASKLTETGAVNKLDQARRQVLASELEAQATVAKLKANAAEERLTTLMGLWGPNVTALLPSTLPPVRAKSRSLASVEQEAMDKRVDLEIARLEAEALARCYGLTRSTRLVNVLNASGISKTQKDKGEPSSDGGGFDIAFEVPIYDFGRASMREAEQRYLEAMNQLGAMAVNARSEAREAYNTYVSTRAIAVQYEQKVLPLRQTISEQTELQYNAMQVDAFALLEAARENAASKVASIQAKRNFWLAYTDLSVALLGVGSLSRLDGTIIADASGGSSD
jgi:outer membrane protein TolC